MRSAEVRSGGDLSMKSVKFEQP